MALAILSFPSRQSHGRVDAVDVSNDVIAASFLSVSPMLSRPFSRQCLRNEIDVELDDAAVGAANLLLLEIDRQRRVGAAAGIVEQLVDVVSAAA